MAVSAIIVAISLPLVNALILPFVASVVYGKAPNFGNGAIAGVIAFFLTGLVIHPACLGLSLMSLTFKNCNRSVSRIAALLTFSLSVTSIAVVSVGSYVLGKTGRW